MENNQKTLVVIVGSTAVGKTDIAIEVAQHFQVEIISADSRQFYHEIPIGTAAPDKNQLHSVEHHFIGHLSVKDDYNVSKFELDVLALLKQKFKTYNLMVMVGGSGLYIDAVLYGIDKLPDPDPELRDKLQNEYKIKGIEVLRGMLHELDPVYYEQVDLANPKRLIRAIEVCIQTGKTYSELRTNKKQTRPFQILKIGLELPREAINQRISQRTDEMLENGWIEEARKVAHLQGLNALNTVGYKELFNYFNNESGLDEAIEKIKTNTRRFAKRQMTWFRRDKEIKWFHPDNKWDLLMYLSERV